MDVDLDSSAAYYRNRAKQERAMASQAPTEEIRKIHAQLADRYAELANEPDERNHSVRSSVTQIDW